MQRIEIVLNGIPMYLCHVDSLAEIENKAVEFLPGGIPSEIQVAIDAKYGTLAQRQTNTQNALTALQDLGVDTVQTLQNLMGDLATARDALPAGQAKNAVIAVHSIFAIVLPQLKNVIIVVRSKP